jgi:signal recognition particle receptor subunit beta
MAKWAKDSGEVSIKIVVVGQTGSGKSSILRHLASSHGQASVRMGAISEAEVTRTEFIWPEPITDGPFVHVRVFALSGDPQHQAAEQLMLAGADGMVFVVDCDPRHIAASRDSLLAMMTNASHVGVDWGKMVVVMQYNRADLYPQLKPQDLDTWLGIEGGKVARFITSSSSQNGLGVAVNDVVEKVIVQLTEQVSKS